MNRFIDRKIMEEMKKYSRGGELTLKEANAFIKGFRLKKGDLEPLLDDIGLKRKGQCRGRWKNAFKIILD